MNLDAMEVVPINEMAGEDATETLELRETYEAAVEYVVRHDWCDAVTDAYFGYGVGGVLGVFLMELARHDDGDRYLWVIAGDLPSAYLVTDQAHNPREALSIYCELMDGWIEAVVGGGALEQVFPVEAEPTRENAELLESRISFIREEMLPGMNPC